MKLYRKPIDNHLCKLFAASLIAVQTSSSLYNQIQNSDEMTSDLESLVNIVFPEDKNKHWK